MRPEIRRNAEPNPAAGFFLTHVHVQRVSGRSPPPAAGLLAHAPERRTKDMTETAFRWTIDERNAYAREVMTDVEARKKVGLQ